MIDLKLGSILPSIFYTEISKDKKNSDILEISILTIKSLMPSAREVGNRIDYKRFYEELRLWKYYRVGENLSLLNILDDPNEDIYFNFKDPTIYSRIIPIILANEKHEIIADEIIKNIIYTTGNIDYLLEWLLIGMAIAFLLENKNTNIEALREYLKEYLINISQVDFFSRYRNFYRIDIEKLDNYKIIFERTRLELLNVVNEIECKKYKYMEDILKVISGEIPKTSLGTILYEASQGLSIDSELNSFYKSMNEYVLRLRKSRINPESLKIEEYILPDIFKYEEGDIFFHSLLKESKVLKKEAKNGNLTSLVKTRSGIYLFRRDPV